MPLNSLILTVYLFDFNMALQTEPQWKSFFTAAGITTAATLDTYAKAFVDNQFTENRLSQLDKDALTELGITTIGHRLSILHAIKERVSSSRPTAKASVTAKLTPLSSDMTHPQFRKFLTDWNVYKSITSLQQLQFTSHLYNACDDVVQNSIINTNKDFLTVRKRCS